MINKNKQIEFSKVIQNNKNLTILLNLEKKNQMIRFDLRQVI